MKLNPIPGDTLRFTAEKTPSEIPVVALNVASWLPSADTVTSTTLVTTPSGITITISNGDTTNPLVTFIGGSHGQRYTLPLLIQTNAGLKIQVTIFIDVKNHIRETTS